MSSDDELQILRVVCDVLEGEDILAVPRDYGNKVLGCIYQEQASLAVLDVQMRAHPQTTATPVIFLTANSRIVSERLPHYREQNATLLPKPFDIVAFIHLVQSLLGQH